MIKPDEKDEVFKTKYFNRILKREQSIAFIEGACLSDCEDLREAIIDRIDVLTKNKISISQIQ